MANFEIQARLDGQWSALSVGSDSDANSFATFGEAQSAVLELTDSFGQIVDADATDNSATGVTVAIDVNGAVREYRVVEL
jgi:hypothetical protein